jgi:phosphoglucomutase
MTAPGAHPRAGTPPEPGDLVDLARLLAAYEADEPDPSDPAQRVSFGTSGHRGSSLRRTFNEAHVVAISAAVCRYREAEGIRGPLFLGRDTHALSEPAYRTIAEVLAGHGVDVVLDAADAPTPTPVISHAILTHDGQADGIVVTPSHNPPDDGGFKYNPPHGGPADTDVTGWIEREANALLDGGWHGVPRTPLERAESVHRRDYVSAYVEDLAAVIDLDAIRSSGLRLGVDPLGGASVAYWQAIAERHGLDLEIVDATIDPAFAMVPLDHDGKIRMDCSSPYAMARLTELRDRFDVAFGNDPDADRHGIVTPSAGLLNPNHHLAACASYLLGGHRDWGAGVGIGKTLVSSSIIDRLAADAGRRLVEVPVGFKWFVGGLLAGELGFAGEESAGASFLRRDGRVWSTDKDGLIPCLLAAEMTATTGRDPGATYAALADRFGYSAYRRIDVPAGPREKDALKRLDPTHVPRDKLGGEPILDVLTRAPGIDASIGVVKVVAEHGWFAVRPSGTEDVSKLYAESLLGEEHLERIVADAQRIVKDALERAGAGKTSEG